MKKTVKIRHVLLGEGIPKICVPVTGVKHEEIIAQMEKIYGDYREIVDIIELRIDFFDNVSDDEKLSELLRSVRQTIIDMPLLLTFRSKREGGQKEISSKQYTMLIKHAIDSGMVDAVDVEAFFDDGILREISAYARDRGAVVIASYHDFDKTPEASDIVKRLKHMEKEGADIAKIAVMPQSKKDVARLIAALCEADEKLCIPVIAISMGRLGVVSRVSGEVFGSCLTFGAIDAASAPGQIEAGKLKNTLELLSQTKYCKG